MGSVANVILLLRSIMSKLSTVIRNITNAELERNGLCSDANAFQDTLKCLLPILASFAMVIWFGILAQRAVSAHQDNNGVSSRTGAYQ